MLSPLESVCRITSFAVLLCCAGAPIHISTTFALLLEGCNICITAMSHFIRHLTAKNVAPVAAAATTTVTKSCQTVPLSYSQVTELSTQTTSEIQTGQQYTETPSRRTPRFWKETALDRTPKSRAHQEILRKKRQRDAGAQTIPVEEVHNDTEHARTGRRYVKYRLKTAAEKIRASRLQRKYDDSELARHSLSKHVVALEKAAEEHGSRLEAAYQEQASALRTKCEAMFTSFEEVRTAHQSKLQEHESLLAAHEELGKQHDLVMEQINRLPRWMKLLKEDAEEWPQLRQMYSIVDSEASSSEDDNPDYQVQEAMFWSNPTQNDAARDSDSQNFLSTTDAGQDFTAAKSTQASSGSTVSKGHKMDDLELEDERTAATNTILAATGASKSPDLPTRLCETNRVEVAAVLLARMKVEPLESKPAPLFWNQQLVPQAYYEAHLANDAEEYSHATTWDVHASICLEVGSDEDGRPRYFRFVPQVATPQAERILPGPLENCQEKLMQYMSNNLVILAGLQILSEPRYAPLQLGRLPSPGMPIWLRRGRKALPEVKPGARHGRMSRSPGSHNDYGSLENPFDNCYALDSSVEPLSFVYNA